MKEYEAMRRTLIAASVTAVLSMPAEAEQTAEWMVENLATGCAPMSLSVHLWGDAESDSRLLQGARNAAESRLRVARLYNSEPSWQELQISIGIVHSASVVKLQLFRGASDSGYGRPGLVIVWIAETLAVHGDDQRHRQAVSEHLDQFITDYLRANPKCG